MFVNPVIGGQLKSKRQTFPRHKKNKNKFKCCWQSELQYKYYPHRNDAAVWVSVFNLHVSQMKNSSQNLEQPHLIGLINTCRGTHIYINIPKFNSFSDYYTLHSSSHMSALLKYITSECVFNYTRGCACYRAVWRHCEWCKAPWCRPRRRWRGCGPVWCTRSRLHCLCGETERVNTFRKHAVRAVLHRATTWCIVLNLFLI